MIALFFSVVTSVLVGQTLRLAAHLELDRFPLFTVNYTVALLLGLSVSREGFASEPLPAVVLAVFLGVMFVLGFLVFHRAIALTGTGIAATVSRLSVIIPIVVSVLAFSEYLGPAGVSGVLIGVAALPFSGRSLPWRAARRASAATAPQAGDSSAAASASGVLWAIALFLIFGANDTALKLRAELLPGSDAGIFFAFLFGTAMVISMVLTLVRGERFMLKTLLIGVPLGAANYGTSHFLASALEAIPGYVAFTLNSVGIILLSAVAGRIAWREKLRPHNYIFLAAGVVAIILLSGVGARQ